MRLILEEKAQSSVEMLLILGGVLAVAAAVGLYLKSLGQQLEETSGDTIEEATG